MARIAMVGDLHFGVRSGDINFLDFQIAWLEYFIQQLKVLKINTVIQAGDWFDVRKHTDNRVLHYMLTKVIPMFREAGITVYLICGNHDIFYRNSNEIHSTRWLAEFAPDVFKVYNRLDDVAFGVGAPFFMIPWLDEQNLKDLGPALAATDAPYAIGHLEMEGFPMYKGSIAEHGMATDLFDKFKRVFTGHYHTISNQKNIHYLGSPYHLTWSDVVDGDNRGFWVFDPVEDKLELVKNPEFMSLFAVLEYNPDVEYKDGALDAYKGNILKVVVKAKSNERHFKGFIKLLQGLDLIDYKIIDETVVEVKEVTVDEKTLHVDTMTVFKQYIDGQETVSDKAALKALADEIYQEAVTRVQ